MCKFCKCTFRQLTHLKNHIYNVHQRSKKDGSNNKKTKNYLCLRCNRHYSSLWRVIAHNYTSHKNPTMPLFCLFCQKNFMLNSGKKQDLIPLISNILCWTVFIIFYFYFVLNAIIIKHNIRGKHPIFFLQLLLNMLSKKLI